MANTPAAGIASRPVVSWCADATLTGDYCTERTPASGRIEQPRGRTPGEPSGLDCDSQLDPASVGTRRGEEQRLEVG